MHNVTHISLCTWHCDSKGFTVVLVGQWYFFVFSTGYAQVNHGIAWPF